MVKPTSVYRKFPHVSQLLEEKLFLRRKEMRISQSALAERAGLTRNCIQQLECHEHLPQPSTMFDLMKALEFSEEETARFWKELEDAFQRDRAFQRGQTEKPQVV